MYKSKHVVFDVIGTLVSYDTLFTAIDTRLGNKLREQDIKPSLFGFTWIEVAEREYSYLSISGRYVAYETVLEKVFHRVLWKAGIAEPRDFATEEDLRHIMQAYTDMEMRAAANECVQKLRDGGFTVWAFTMGGLERVGGYFQRAGIDMGAEHLLSCDSDGCGKPDLKAYQPLLDRLSKDGCQPWFAAAHMWDVSAARRVGFRGAYCTVWEREPLTEIFGDMEVIADDLSELAKRIMAAT